MKLVAKKHKKIWVMIAAVVLVLVLCGGAVLYQPWINSHNNDVTNTDSEPDIVRVKAPFDEFAQIPKSIIIESLGIDAPILPVGLTADGAMEAPQTNHDVGWYEKSARVGQTSSQSVLLDGHYGAAWDKGVFYDLHKIKEGAKIILAGREDGKATYEVKEIERRKLEEVDMKKAFYKYPDSVQSLTLITCEGQYDASRATYDDRIVVYAVRVS